LDGDGLERSSAGLTGISASQLTYIFDTSPLVTLAGRRAEAQVVIEHLLPLIHPVVVETVALEATANLNYPDAVLLKNLLESGQIARLPVPTTPVDYLIDAYPRLGTGKGKGERDTIRLGLTIPGAKVVIDDQQAFFVAARFELTPITLLDLVTDLARARLLPRTLALKIAQAMVGRYAPVSIQHTVYKLNGVADDSDNN
jgi:hypothetical protein